MITTNKILLAKYKDGNVSITIYSDGTRIQEYVDSPTYDFPISMDIKITNSCNMGCNFCHENSIIGGEHADLEYLKTVLEPLPKGIELAIGGGNPLEHPDLYNFLLWCKHKGFIPNMTINYAHLKNNIDFINKIIDNNLIYGLGISIINTSLKDLKLINNRKNIVLHVICGVFDINKLSELNYKTLILGYKNFGRGKKALTPKIENEIKNWEANISKFFGKIPLSFDNLALNQLDIKSKLSEKYWNSFYQGEDGLSTMYIDAVKKEFAISSCTVERFSIKGDIINCFSYVNRSY